MYLKSSFSPENFLGNEGEKEKPALLIKEGENKALLALKERENVLNIIKNQYDSLSTGDKSIILNRIFEHSVNDGIKIAENFSITADEFTDIVSKPGFYIKNKDIMGDILRDAGRKIEGDQDETRLNKLKTTYEEYDKLLNEEGVFSSFTKTGQPESNKAKALLSKLDSAYTPFLAMAELKSVEKEHDHRSDGERMGENNLEYIKPALEENYYPGDIFKIIFKNIKNTDQDFLIEQAKSNFSESTKLQEKYKHSGFNAYLTSFLHNKENIRETVLKHLSKQISQDYVEKIKWQQFISKEELQKIKSSYAIADEKQLKEINNARYKPLDVTFNIQNKDAQKKLAEELKEILGTDFIFNEKTNKYETKCYKSEKLESENPEKNERAEKYLSEEKILDKLDKLIKEGAGKGYIARGLAGLDSDRAWQMRDKFIEEGADKGSIARGLAGLDSDRAWKMRDKLIKEGAGKGYIARGLAGDYTTFAWQLNRNKETFNSKESKVVDRKLNLLNLLHTLNPNQIYSAIESKLEKLESENPEKNERAEKYLSEEKILDKLDKLIKEGADKVYIARGLAGLDSDRAWQMRDEFIKEGVNKGSISMGLAGLDSDRAWQMRDEFIKEGVYKGSISMGLAGDYTTFAWQLNRNKEKENKKIELQSKRNENLDNVEFNPNELLQQINEYLGNKSLLSKERKLSLKEKLKRGIQTSSKFITFINKTITESPKTFLDTMAAKKDSQFIYKKLTRKIFRSISKKEKDSTWRGFSGYLGFNKNEDIKRNPSPEDYLDPDTPETMTGGDPEGEGQNVEVMKFREPINELVVTGVLGKCNGANWDKLYEFSIDKTELDDAKEITITLPKVGRKIKLPKPISSEIILERVKGVKKEEEEIHLIPDISPMREGIIADTNEASEIIYSVQRSEIPREINNITDGEYQKFKEKFIKENGSIMIEPITGLSDDIKLFLESIKNQTPKEQVIDIEKFIRTISYYDMKNGEVMPIKRGTLPDERFEIMSTRIDELKEKTPDESLQGKLYAGVCADFAVLASATLREAGFLSGILSGFLASGKSATIGDAHGTAFVVWPNKHGGTEIFSVDGTPSGVAGISGNSLEDLEEIREQKIDKLKEDADKKLTEIQEILNSYDEESIKKLTNGKLEEVLNIVLKYDVSEKNVQVLENLLQSYWYTPFSKLDLQQITNKNSYSRFVEKEIETQKEALKENIKNPGSKLFGVVEEFIQKFQKSGKVSSSQEALLIIDSITDAAKKHLTAQEIKSLTVISTYLKAKQIKGNK